MSSDINRISGSFRIDIANSALSNALLQSAGIRSINEIKDTFHKAIICISDDVFHIDLTKLSDEEYKNRKIYIVPTAQIEWASYCFSKEMDDFCLSCVGDLERAIEDHEAKSLQALIASLTNSYQVLHNQYVRCYQGLYAQLEKEIRSNPPLLPAMTMEKSYDISLELSDKRPEPFIEIRCEIGASAFVHYNVMAENTDYCERVRSSTMKESREGKVPLQFHGEKESLQNLKRLLYRLPTQLQSPSEAYHIHQFADKYDISVLRNFTRLPALRYKMDSFCNPEGLPTPKIFEEELSHYSVNNNPLGFYLETTSKIERLWKEQLSPIRSELMPGAPEQQPLPVERKIAFEEERKIE